MWRPRPDFENFDAQVLASGDRRFAPISRSTTKLGSCWQQSRCRRKENENVAIIKEVEMGASLANSVSV
jgi:hypothetical protein